jgi:hypothetical protein
MTVFGATVERSRTHTLEAIQEELTGETGPAEVELVLFDGYPHWRDAFAHLEVALAQLGRSDYAKPQLVTNEAEAQQHHMAGSPTLLIDGRDLILDGRLTCGCRLFPGEAGREVVLNVRTLVELPSIEVRPHAHCPPTTLW